MPKTNKLVSIIKNLLVTLGEDINRDGLIETPNRIARMYQDLLQGYSIDPKTIFKEFDSDGFGDLIIISNIHFYSLCEHHMMPFFGNVHIGYIPNGRILGLSKFARIVDVFAKRLQVQENLTKQIADCIMQYLKPKGVIILSEAEHLCMSMRGVRKEGSITKVITSRGIFNKDKKLVNDFFLGIKR